MPVVSAKTIVIGRVNDSESALGETDSAKGVAVAQAPKKKQGQDGDFFGPLRNLKCKRELYLPTSVPCRKSAFGRYVFSRLKFLSGTAIPSAPLRTGLAVLSRAGSPCYRRSSIIG